jgi:hypothetical protein
MPLKYQYYILCILVNYDTLQEDHTMAASSKQLWNLLFLFGTLSLFCSGCYRLSDNASREESVTGTSIAPTSTNIVQILPITNTPHEPQHTETTISQTPTQSPTPTVTPTSTSPYQSTIDFELIGQFGGSIHDLEIQDSFLYIAVGIRVVVVDISNPWSPRFVGQSDIFDSIVVDIVLAGDFAYVVSHERSLYTLDLSNPNALRTIGSFQIRHEPSALAVKDKYVFISEQQCIMQKGGPCHYVGGLQIIDVSNPTQMQEAAFIDKDDGYNDVVIKDIHAYVTGAKEGLTIFNISNPSVPYPMGTEPSVFGQISFVGEFAYIKNSNASSAIVDVSDPAAPVVVTDSLGRCTGALAFFDGYIYNLFSRCYSMETGLEVLEAPGGLAKDENGTVNVIGRILDGFEVSGDPDIVIQGKMAYATGSLGIQIIDLKDPSNPVVIKQLLMPGPVNDVAMYQGFAYVLRNDANGSSPLYVLDATQPSSIRPLDSVYNIPLTHKGLGQVYYLNVFIEGKFAFITVFEPEGLGENRFSIFDLSQPLQPKLVWEEQMTLVFDGLAFSKDLAFAYTSRSEGVTIFNMSNPSNAFIESTIPIVGVIQELEVVGDLAYVWIAGEGFKIYDWSDFQSPQLMSELTLEGHARGLVIENDIALVSQGSILAIDVSDPFHPQVISSFELPVGVGNLTIDNGYLYASGGEEGLLVFRFNH